MPFAKQQNWLVRKQRKMFILISQKQQQIIMLSVKVIVIKSIVFFLQTLLQGFNFK